MELTPRTDDPQPGRRSRSRALLAAVVVLLIGVAGFLMMRALSDATVFFKNADEAVAERGDLGTQRFRLQGTVVPGSVEATSDGVDFRVSYNQVEVAVRHVGDPVDLFQEGIPVVLEGSWGAELYESDWMAVKHSEAYESENPERLDETAEKSDAP